MGPRTTPDTLRGSPDLLVLKTLSLEPMHGWGISRRIQQFSIGVSAWRGTIRRGVWKTGA